MTTFTRLLAVAVLGGVLILLLGPATSIESARPGFDKVAHFVAFGLVLWALGVLIRRTPRLVLALAAIGLGGLTEIVQGLVGRDAELLDFVADAAGVLMALGLWALWRGFRPRTSATEASFKDFA